MSWFTLILTALKIVSAVIDWSEKRGTISNAQADLLRKQTVASAAKADAAVLARDAAARRLPDDSDFRD